MYTSAGDKTCKGDRPGSFGHYETDAATLASWGVDFVKMDHCGNKGNRSDQELYGNMSRALNATGRPVLFSLCNWGEADVWTWGADIAQMYRIQMDHLPFWKYGDGNSSDGDGCSAACEVECGFACEKKSEGLRIFSTCTRHCGDGVVQWELGEECDDTSKCCDGCRLAPSHNAECSGACCDADCKIPPNGGACTAADGASAGVCVGAECVAGFPLVDEVAGPLSLSARRDVPADDPAGLLQQVGRDGG